MGCISPTVIRKGAYAMTVPCRRCSQCIAKRVSELTMLVRLEMASPLYRTSGSSFICLTYNNSSLPVSPAGYMTLSKSDLYHFMQRLRVQLRRSGYEVPLKYVSCGEYGENGRPHYHICLLGISPALAEPAVRRAWLNGSNGLIDVKPLQLSGVGYVCKYLSKSHPIGKVKAEYERRQAIPPFVHTSKGLAKNWIFNHLQEIIDSEFLYTDVKTGQKRLYPKKIRDYVEFQTGIDPRPYVEKYIKTIDTHGMTLDDYNSVSDYLHARNEYLKSVKSGKPAYQLTNCRLPPLMRSKFNTDFHSVVSEI